MTDQESINSLLRPTEVCHVSCDVRYVKRNGERKRRILAVVMNVQGGEEACVFMLKRRVGNTASIYDLLPIYADFRLAVSQSKPVRLDDPDRPSVGRTDFTLRLSSGKREIKLETSALEALQPVLVELKRLMAVSQQRNYVVDGGTHTWVQYYEKTRRRASTALKHSTNDEAEEDRAQSALPNPFIHFDNSVTGNNVKAIKEGWAAKELRAREAKFVDFERKRIFVGSWNVNGQSPSESLTPWLDVPEGNDPALFVLGFQELDLNTGAYLYSDTTKEDEWCKAIEKALQGRGQKYVKVVSKQLVGMLVVLYVVADEREKIREISAEYLGTGLLGMMGNKGATAIRFRFHDSYYCFVNAHLAADTSMVERRNQDYQEICRRIAFSLPAQYLDFTAYTHINPWVASYYDSRQSSMAVVGTPASGSGIPGRNVATVFDVDHLFFLGDLNYRVSLPEADVKAMVNRGEIEQLLKFDQLLMEQTAKRAFHNFNEAPISFPPTFKFDIGTSTYDTSEKKRTPSFCDRILWYQNPLRVDDEDWIKPHWYWSCMDLKLSDHKPIKALFETKVRKIDNERLTAVHEDIIRELDKFENESLPDLGISANILELGDIRFGVPVTRTLVVENKGQVIAQYRFIPKPEETRPCQPWLFINPPVGMLLPGDHLRINITIFVDNATAPFLNSATDALDDILIMHTENGKDHFISISGSWLTSCFGTTLDALCRFVKPVREWTVEERMSIMQPTDASESTEAHDLTQKTVDDGLSPVPPVPDAENRLSLPFQLWRMVDFLYRFGMDVDNLFTSAGDPAIEEYIRECLDTGADFDLSVLLVEPESGRPQSPDDLDDGEDSVGEEGEEPTSRRSSTNSDHSGTRTPIEKRSSVQIDIENLLKDNPNVRPTSLLGLGSAASITPKSQPPTPPRPRGRAISVCSMAETLIKFLDSLAEPVVPESMALRCMQEGYLTFVAARQTVQRLPRINHAVFRYIVRFLRVIAEGYRGRGELDVERLVDIFAPLLLRIPKSMQEAKSESTITVTNTKTVVTPNARASATTTITKTADGSTKTVTKYATVSAASAGALKTVAGKVMVGGGTGGIIGLERSSSSNDVLSDGKGGKGTTNQEEVLVRKRRMFLMQFLDPTSPELD